MATSSNNNSTIQHQLLLHHHHEVQRHAAYPFQPSSASSPKVKMMIQTRQPPSSSSSHQGLMGNGEHQVEDVQEGGAVFLYLHGRQHQRHGDSTAGAFNPQLDQSCASGMRPPTLNIFPSLPVHENLTSTLNVNNNLGFVAGGSYSANKNLFDETPFVSPTNQGNNGQLTPDTVKLFEENRLQLQQHRGSPSNSEQQGRQKQCDAKTLRRVAQNREAARKSRLRKKAYIQQLESSRMKLAQLEQELHRSGTTGQGSSVNGGFVGHQPNLSMRLNFSSDAVVFDMEYSRWLEENQKLTSELRAAFVEQLPENELRLYVNDWLAHFDHLKHLKSMVAKTDPFHLLSGCWKSPAERCFLWIGGFKPSHVIQIILKRIDQPLSDDQLMVVYALQSSSQESEDALSSGLDSLCQSLSNTIVCDSLSSPNDMANYMAQMSMGVDKLSTLEGFVRQADNLRRQTIRRLDQILTVRQAARCFLTFSEYSHSLRALSTLWLARPR